MVSSVPNLCLASMITIKLRAKENVCIDAMCTVLGSPPMYNIHTVFYSNG